MDIKGVLVQWFIIFFDKKTSGNVIKNENILKKELPEKLYKPISKTFKRRKVHSPFIDNIWVSDLADMQLISKFNKQIHILQCVVDIYSKYAWDIPLKYEKDIAITNVFQKNLNESNRCEAKSKGCKPNKIWVDKGSEFYNRSVTSWLEKNDVEMYSMHNEGKSFC